jgi:NADPH:quinone reductase-like Zn-dependent oxidoreductase
MKTMLPQKMTAVFVNTETGKLLTKQVDVPKPGKGEVLIKMLAAPINPSDLAKAREITAEKSLTFIPGIEGCGRVVAAGKGFLPSLFLGKRVAFFAKYPHSGSWAEYILTTAGSCFPLSKSISNEQAAMLIVNPMTALAFLDFAKKNKHKAVISTAAGGALGKLISNLFEKNQIKMLNIVRNEEAAEKLRKENRKNVMHSSEIDFQNKLKNWCEVNKATLLFDAVGGELLSSLLPILPACSTVLLYGNLSLQKIEFMPTELLRENKKIVGFFLGHWIEENGMIKTASNLINVNHLLKKGMETRVQASFSLNDIQKAVDLYEGNMSLGKVLLKG